MKFNFLKITTFALATIAILNFSSCNKEAFGADLDSLISSQEADLTFEESNYTIFTENLSNTEDSEYYTEGIITYSKNGIELAKVDFGNGSKNEDYSIKKNGIKKYYKLKKADKYDYEKVIVQPLVKTSDCKYPTSGIVDFFKDGAWVATVDFGDGTCDKWATKTYTGGSKVFDLKYLK